MELSNAARSGRPRTSKTDELTAESFELESLERVDSWCPKRLKVTADAQRMIELLRRTGNLWRTLRSKPVRLNELSLQWDNARPHIASLTKDFLQERDVATVWHSPYSPDFNLCDRFLFVWLKNALRGETFNSTSEVEEASLQFLRSISEDALRHQVDLILDNFHKVIDAGEFYTTE